MDKKELDKQIEAIRQARKRKLVINMLTVFGDDSADEKEQRVFAVAGVLGSRGEWDALEPKWNERTGGIPFHAADCEAGRAEYKKIHHEDRLRLYADLIKMVTKSNLLSYIVCMDLNAFYRFLPDAIDHAPYLICFRAVVVRFAKLASVCIPPEKVEFVFDHNATTAASADALYHYMAQTDEWKYGQYMADMLGFACRKTVGIQVADILAREAMKHCDNFMIHRHPKRPVRQSMNVLLSSRRHWFKYLDTEHFKKEKSNPELNEEADHFKADDYLTWLSHRRMNDTVPNKYEFLLRLERGKI
ncbi:MAG: hypothetical protein ACYC7J_09050 [Syntrophales bacterium]